MARKAKAKKNKPSKVYTEEDLAQMRSGSVSVVGQDGGEGNGSPETSNYAGDSKTQDKGNGGKNGEAYWRGKARKLQEQIAAVDQEIEKMKQEIKTSGGSGFDAASSLQQNVIYINDRNGRLKRLEDKKAKLMEQMAQLQEEGRKAGADPGWFR
jgi:chromosome segregation ATPase